MRLSEDQVAAALYAVRDLISRRQLGGRPIPKAVLELHHALSEGSVCGTEKCSGTEQLDVSDTINAQTAASIIGCSDSFVRRIAADLDGWKVGRDWVFRRQVVVDYAEAKGVGGDSNRVPPARSGAVPPRVA